MIGEIDPNEMNFINGTNVWLGKRYDFGIYIFRYLVHLEIGKLFFSHMLRCLYMLCSIPIMKIFNTSVCIASLSIFSSSYISFFNKYFCWVDLKMVRIISIGDQSYLRHDILVKMSSHELWGISKYLKLDFWKVYSGTYTKEDRVSNNVTWMCCCWNTVWNSFNDPNIMFLPDIQWI